MTLRQVVTLVGVGLLAAGGVLADTMVDPRGTIIYSTNSSGVGFQFTFTINSSGGGIFHFFNASGSPWTSVDITLFAPTTDLSQYNCSPGTGQQVAFENCSFSLSPDPLSPTGFDVSLLYNGVVPPDDGPPPPPPPGGCQLHPHAPGCEVEDSPEGIFPGQSFQVDMNNLPTGGAALTGGWVPGSTASAQAFVPEPGTLILLITVAGILGARQSLRRRRG